MALLGAEVVRLGISGYSQIPYGSFAGKAAAPPVFSGTIPDISLEESTTATDYDLSIYFTGATSYSISPAVETGWTFNTSTGVLTILPNSAGTYGPYTVTGTNPGGSDSSNAFGVAVTAAALPGGSSDPPRRWKRETREEIERRRKFYKDLATAREARAAPPKEPEPEVKAPRRPILHLVKPAPEPVVLPGADAVAQPVDFLTEELKKALAGEAERIRKETLRLEMLRKRDEALLLLLLD